MPKVPTCIFKWYSNDKKAYSVIAERRSSSFLETTMMMFAKGCFRTVARWRLQVCRVTMKSWYFRLTCVVGNSLSILIGRCSNHWPQWHSPEERSQVLGDQQEDSMRWDIKDWTSNDPLWERISSQLLTRQLRDPQFWKSEYYNPDGWNSYATQRVMFVWYQGLEAPRHTMKKNIIFIVIPPIKGVIVFKNWNFQLACSLMISLEASTSRWKKPFTYRNVYMGIKYLIVRCCINLLSWESG